MRSIGPTTPHDRRFAGFGGACGAGDAVGTAHGAFIRGVMDFIDACERARARTAVRNRLNEARRLSGFGHLLYPMGDPRAAVLPDDLPASKSFSPLRAFVTDETGERPNVDFAIAVNRTRA